MWSDGWLWPAARWKERERGLCVCIGCSAALKMYQGLSMVQKQWGECGLGWWAVAGGVMGACVCVCVCVCVCEGSVKGEQVGDLQDMMSRLKSEREMCVWCNSLKYYHTLTERYGGSLIILFNERVYIQPVGETNRDLSNWSTWLESLLLRKVTAICTLTAARLMLCNNGVH